MMSEKIFETIIWDDSCPGRYCDCSRRSRYVPNIPSKIQELADSNPDQIDLDTLIELSECYHCKRQTHFGDISLRKLALLRSAMRRLNSVIGMSKIKQEIADLIVYNLSGSNDNDSMHTVIYGQPGIGKTMVVKLISDIYLGMGMLTKDIIHNVKLSDLKGKYVGHTAPKVQAAIEKALGGVLVIDEAYSLSANDADVFSVELIDTLNRNLTEYAGKFACIIIGYKDQIEKRFFSQNPGLHSRFRFRFEIDPYSSEELAQIFLQKVSDNKLFIKPGLPVEEFFKKNIASFPYYGRDVETLLSHIKVAHRSRTFFATKGHKGIITMEDINAGYRKYSAHNKPKETVVTHMYI